MDRFWQFRNLSPDEGELVLYGQIASSKSWWDDSGDGIYPKQFSDDLKGLGNIKNLTVRLNSPGGDVFAATAIYTQLKSHIANVTVVIEGVAASAATIIMAAADTVKAPANALVMIHNPMLMLYGYYNTDELAKMSNVLGTVKDSILSSYKAKTGRDATDLSKMMDQETWMTGEEAKAEGFVDEILFEESVEATITNDNKFMVVNSLAIDMGKFQTRPMMGKKPALDATKPVIPEASNNKPKEREDALEIKNLDDLKKAYPDFCNQIASDAATAAATTERDRLKSIDDISATVDPGLVAKAKYETPMSAQALAFESLKADAGKGRTFNNDRDQELANAEDVTAGAPPEKADAVKDAAAVDRIAASMNQKRHKEAGR